MPILPHISHFVSLCAKKHINKVIICPGSRNAALSIAFDSHPEIETIVVSDERSAAFIALGIALDKKQGVAILSTSGSASINLFPAIAEAFFNEVPLLIITADRPKEWINQNDGQTIFQNNLFGNHVKYSCSFNANNDKDFYVNRISNELINCMNEVPKGPVHVNIEVSEPFYPEKEKKYLFDTETRAIEFVDIKKTISKKEWSSLIEEFLGFERIIIFVGQQFDKKVSKILNQLSKELNIVVVGDILSNAGKEAFYFSDLFIKSSLKPQLLISIGKSTISKKLKLFLRKENIENHWHVSEETGIIDPFISIKKIIKIPPIDFLEKLYEDLDFLSSKNRFDPEDLNPYFTEFSTISKTVEAKKNKELAQLPWSDLKAVDLLFNFLPKKSILHLGNSMPVRYANLININRKIQVFCNRGTSGIEGVLSTALGHSLVTKKPVFCLIGDVSFHYDKNAFWNDLDKKNLKIIILNNNGGNIFRMIDGPTNHDNYKTLFETNQSNNAKYIAKEYGYEYYSVKSEGEILEINKFIENKNPSILEFFTQPDINEKTYKSIINFGK